MALTIDDLLNSLQNPNKPSGKLENTKDTWKRIGNGDSFAELGMEASELETFLAEWISDNPYNNI
jgi:hypothetical protein